MRNYFLPGFPTFPIYSGWTQYTPVIPKMYWNAYSIEQIIKDLVCNFDKVEHYLDYVAELMNQWGIEFDSEMQAQFEEMWNVINNGIENGVEHWINSNLTYIFDKVVKQVYFGLNEQGYFVAYIPDGWDDIVFDTGASYGLDTYGRLILRWDVDNSNESVNQRPEDWS